MAPIAANFLICQLGLVDPKRHERPLVGDEIPSYKTWCLFIWSPPRRNKTGSLRLVLSLLLLAARLVSRSKRDLVSPTGTGIPLTAPFQTPFTHSPAPIHLRLHLHIPSTSDAYACIIFHHCRPRIHNFIQAATPGHRVRSLARPPHSHAHLTRAPTPRDHPSPSDAVSATSLPNPDDPPPRRTRRLPPPTKSG